MRIVLTLLLVAVASSSAQFYGQSDTGFGLPLPQGLSTGFNQAYEGANQAGQAGHGQLMNYGKVQSENIDYAGQAVQNLWQDFHDAFHGHADNMHSGLITFGHTMQGQLEKISPAAAGLWAGFQKQIDSSIGKGNQRLIEMGGAVQNNLQHGRGQAAASWQAIRDNVDRPIHQSLGTGNQLSTPRPHGPSGNSVGAGLHVSVASSSTPAPLSDNLLDVNID